MARKMAIIALIACGVACDKRTPSAPTPAPNPVSPNQSPQIVVGTVTPALGIEQVTAFAVRIEVRDPDGDQVVLTVTGCSFGNDTPATLENGVVDLSFKADRCGSSLSLRATDTRGAVTQATVPFQYTSLKGPFRLVIGDGLWSQPAFRVNLTQSGTVVTGTIRDYRDYSHPGTIDPQGPGVIDEEGRFRLRFKVQSEPDELVLAGQMVSANRDPFIYVMVASGQVIGARYAGKTFQLWHEAEY